ncbi:MAG TPA: PIG-L family deacetylase [Candidatus Saccharimonadales bacterium]
MKKVLFGIFAHPDDEGFGPSGTLIKMAQNGVDIHLICLTRGEAGMNVDNYENLGAVRSQEWHKAGELIGATSMKQFDFGDGRLCNAWYHEIAAAIESHVNEKLQTYQEPVEVEFLTFDHTGITGHLDHIAVSMITSFVFICLSKQPTRHHFSHIRLFCLPPTICDNDVSYVYWPAGRIKTDETIDISDVFDKKLAVMHAHYSQRSDAAMLLERLGELMKQESFCFLKPRSTGQES